MVALPGFTAEKSLYDSVSTYQFVGTYQFADAGSYRLPSESVSAQSLTCAAIGIMYGLVHPVIGLIAEGVCLAVEA